MSTIRSRNAAKVLPPAVLREVQRYAAGMSLWVPVVQTRAEKRRLKVLALRANGLKQREIAVLVGLSVGRVKAILKADRQAAARVVAAPASQPVQAGTCPGPDERRSGRHGATAPSRAAAPADTMRGGA